MTTTALTDWLSRLGAHFPSVGIGAQGSHGRFLYATADIPEGETAIRIPHQALLTLDVVRKSPIGRQLLAADIDLPTGHTLLAAYILTERRRPSGPFAPYIGILPPTFPTVPIFFHRELAPILRGSFAASLISRRREMLCRDFVHLHREVPAFRDVSLGEFIWARTAVITRVFGVKMRGSSTEVMVPFGDMVNHRRPPDLDWIYDEGERAFIMKAARDIRAGEEIMDSYGRKPNGRYFVHYGFALGEGADDEIELTLTLPRDDPRHGQKARELRRLGGAQGEYRISNKLRHEGTLRAFSFLRTAAATDSELARAVRLLAKGDPVTPLSARNEAAALTLLEKACTEALARFDSPTEADDEALLATADLPVNLRNALLVRRGEKRLLQSYRRLAQSAVTLLRLPKRTFFTAAAQFSGENLTTSYLLDLALALAPREARPPSFRSIGL